VGLLVTTGVDGIGIVAESITEALTVGVEDTGVSEMVAFPELGGRTVALLGTPEEVDGGSSEAGTLVDSIADGVGVGTDETPVPTEPEGRTPELNPLEAGGAMLTLPDENGVSLAVGGAIEEGATLGVSLGSSVEIGAVGVSDAVGTAPEGVGMTPEDISDAMLDAMLLAGGRGTDAVAVGSSETKLDTMLGTTDPGRSDTAEDRRLETSETSEETTGGSTPEGVGVGDGVVGAVGPAEPEGRIPVSSDTRDGKRVGTTASDVGIAPELRGVLEGVSDEAPVPRAVVIPTTMPAEEGTTAEGCSTEGDAEPEVGSTTLLGKTPVGLARGAWDEVGWITGSEMPPVEPGTIKGPRKLDAAGVDGSGDATGNGELEGTTTSGIPPVEPTRWPDRSEEDTGASGAGVGWTTDEGTRPVDPTSPPRSDDKTLSEGALVGGSDDCVGTTISGIRLPVPPREGLITSLRDARLWAADVG
jgi:hypothetical protein